MGDRRPQRGPWYHRVLVWGFSVVFGVLVYWLLGFALGDLGTLPGPDYSSIERDVLDADTVARSRTLSERLESIGVDIEARAEQQRDLRDSTDSAETTMYRLIEMQRLALEKDRELSDAERRSLAEARDLFLSNQKQYQSINREIAALKEQRRSVAHEADLLSDSLEQQRVDARLLYDERRQKHEVKMAALKLAVVVPMLLLALLAFVRWSKSAYVPLIYAFGIASATKTGLVMHEHFPTRYFKYVLIGVAIGTVVWVLTRLIRRMTRPAAAWLLRQYREAYERLICPICDYPIRLGPLRYRYWNRRTVKRLSVSLDHGSADVDEEPYTCPACSTPLFEKCAQCDRVRPSLMSACPHCGATRPASAILEAAAGR